MKADGYEHRVPPPPKRHARHRARARGPHDAGLMNATSYIKPCACGGEIVAIRLDEDDLTAAVWAHRQTIQHQAWIRRWRDGEG